jgi:hypothetical protein
MDGLNHLCKAAQTLGEDGAPFPERFLSAVDDFWAAVFDIDGWPPHLLNRGEGTVDRILALRLPRPNPAEIDGAAAKAIAEEIVRLANDLRAGANYVLKSD